MTLKILNLYAGIGGNRKLWEGNIEVTAVELDPTIAKIYQEFFPNDKVIITDAHQYLLEHYKEYDFIWSSPPCPTHSRMRLILNEKETTKQVYPDMKLYQEIILLQNWFKGKYVVENVISYYDPLIKPFVLNNHYFWSNFIIDGEKDDFRGIIRMKTDESIEHKEKKFKIDLSKYEIPKQFKVKVLNNCVNPETGLHIFKQAFKERQTSLKVIPSNI